MPKSPNQVMLRVFFFFATFGEALSQTAQAFIPGQLARERSIKAARAAASFSGDGVGLTSLPGNEAIDPRLSPARAMMRQEAWLAFWRDEGAVSPTPDNY